MVSLFVVCKALVSLARKQKGDATQFAILSFPIKFPGAVVPTACKSVLMETRLAVGFLLEHQPKFRRDWLPFFFGHIVCRDVVTVRC